MDALKEFIAIYTTPEALGVLGAILFIDLVLAGDNAIIVGMVASRVPKDMRKKVIFWGIGAAVVMRIGFSLAAVFLLQVPGLMFVGALLLFWVVWNLGKELWETHKRKGQEEVLDADGEEFTSMRPAIIQIVIADLSMSIDNVLAIAGVSHEYPVLLVFGLVLSVALMIFAATLIAELLQKYPWIAWLGLVMIFYVAVTMLYSGGGQLLEMMGFIDVKPGAA